MFTRKGNNKHKLAFKDPQTRQTKALAYFVKRSLTLTDLNIVLPARACWRGLRLQSTIFTRAWEIGSSAAHSLCRSTHRRCLTLDMVTIHSTYRWYLQVRGAPPCSHGRSHSCGPEDWSISPSKFPTATMTSLGSRVQVQVKVCPDSVPGRDLVGTTDLPCTRQVLKVYSVMFVREENHPTAKRIGGVSVTLV